MLNKEQVADLKTAIEMHRKWLNDEEDGKRLELKDNNLSNSNLRGSNLSCSYLYGCNLSNSNLRGSNLSYSYLYNSNLSDNDLRGSNLSSSNLSYSNLSYSLLYGSNLSNSNLSYSNLSYCNLSGSNLSYSNLRGSNLNGSNLSYCNLSYCDLSGAVGVSTQWQWVSNNLTKTDNGYICYKTFNEFCKPNKEWKVAEGETITENVNFDRCNPCACGINVGTLEYVLKNTKKDEVWECLIPFEALAGVCIPYNTDGRFRCEMVKLIKKYTKEELLKK